MRRDFLARISIRALHDSKQRLAMVYAGADTLADSDTVEERLVGICCSDQASPRKWCSPALSQCKSSKARGESI